MPASRPGLNFARFTLLRGILAHNKFPAFWCVCSYFFHVSICVRAPLIWLVFLGKKVFERIHCEMEISVKNSCCRAVEQSTWYVCKKMMDSYVGKFLNNGSTSKSIRSFRIMAAEMSRKLLPITWTEHKNIYVLKKSTESIFMQKHAFSIVFFLFNSIFKNISKYSPNSIIRTYFK